MNDVDSTAVPLSQAHLDRVLDVLHAAAAAERAAAGSALRIAYRTSRHLLGGALQLGLATGAIADALGVRPSSVRARSNVDGLVDGHRFAALAGISLSELSEWEHEGLIRLQGPDNGGMYGYQASTLLGAHIYYRAGRS